MKKVIVAVIATIVAVVTNAATLQWSQAKFYLADGTTSAGSKVTMYVFGITQSEFNNTYTSEKAITGAFATINENTITVNDADWSKKSASGKISTTSDETVGTVYKALIFTYTDTTTGNMWYEAKTVSATVTDLGGDIAEFAPAAGDWTELKSSPEEGIPEPTSGILLLVGGAMLALRRRRA